MSPPHNTQRTTAQPGDGKKHAFPWDAPNVQVRRIKHGEAKPWCLYKHYARRVPSISFAFGLYVNEILEGVITYGFPTTPQVKRGMFTDKSISVIELNRLCVDTKIKNAASILVGRSLNLLLGPLAVVSYADSGQGHIGYVYQATNFIYTGAVTAHDSEYLVAGRKVHPRNLAHRGITSPKQWAKENNIEIVKPSPKHRYVFFIGPKKERKHMLISLNYPVITSYPKGNTRRSDFSFPWQLKHAFFPWAAS